MSDPEQIAISWDVRVGLSTATGRRAANEDYAAYRIGSDERQRALGLAFVVADGMGGHKGGRVAAEMSVNGFLDVYFSCDERQGVLFNATQSLKAANRLVRLTGQANPDLENMGCTFTALILHGGLAHMAHVGDTRLYRLRDGILTRLSTDHVVDRPRMRHLLTRAVGTDEDLLADYAAKPAQPLDRYLLASDGVHGGLTDTMIGQELARHDDPETVAKRLVALALATPVGDNATALVIDVLGL